MKKLLFTVLSLIAVWSIQATDLTIQAYGNAKVEKTAPGVYKFTASPGKGWPQIRIAIPKGTVWKDAGVYMTIKKLSPAGKITCGVLLGTVKPDRNAIKAGYINSMIPPDKEVNLKFQALANNG